MAGRLEARLDKIERLLAMKRSRPPLFLPFSDLTDDEVERLEALAAELLPHRTVILVGDALDRDPDQPDIHRDELFDIVVSYLRREAGVDGGPDQAGSL